MQKTSRSLEHGFMLVTDGSGIDKAPRILSQSGQPEATLLDLIGPQGPRVVGEFGAVSSLEDHRLEVRWNVQAFWWTGTGSGLVLDGGLDLSSISQVKVVMRRDDVATPPEPT